MAETKGANFRLSMDTIAAKLLVQWRPPDCGQEKDSLAQLYHCFGDEEASTLLRRHLQLGLHYLALSKDHMDVEELSMMGRCLKFLAGKVQSAPEYRDLLVGLLGKSCRPVVFKKSTELLPERNPIPDFLGSLGECVEFLSWSGELQLLVLEVLWEKLEREDAEPGVVSSTQYREAATRSSLGSSLLGAAKTAGDRAYCRILALLSLLVLHCDQGDILLSQDLAELLLTKLSLGQVLTSLQLEVKQRTTDLLWDILLEQDNPSFQVLPVFAISKPAVLRLKEWFRRDVLYGNDEERRQIAALLLTITRRSPHLDIYTTQVIQDICLIGTATELGTAGTWADGRRNGPPEYELQLKKTLLTMVCYTFDHAVSQLAADEHGLLSALSTMLELRRQSHVPWSSRQRLELAVLALRAIPIAAKTQPSQYSVSGATQRILRLVEEFSTVDRDMRLAKLSCWCLARLANLRSLHRHLVAAGVPSILLGLAQRLLDSRLTVLIQEVLDQAFQVLGELGCGGRPSTWGCHGLGEFGARVLSRLQAPAPADSRLLDSLFISAGEFLWVCVILSEDCRKKFIENEGVYMILNLIEASKFPVQLFYLGMLVETCTEGESLGQLVTWRGKKGENGVLSMLCALWREQEARKRVRREPHGCIQDIECPLTGEWQRKISVENMQTAPALVEMIGCLRPRIAAIVHLLTRAYRDTADLLKTLYLIPYDQVDRKDKITLEVIQYYEDLKEGEMFKEIQAALDSTKMKLIQLDVSVVHNLLMRHVGAAKTILQNQLAILRSDRAIEEQAEKSLYEDIQESEMMRTLNVVKEVKRTLRLSHLGYLENNLTSRTPPTDTLH